MKEGDNMSFSDRLKRARKHVGMTQKAIADNLGITPQSYAQYETNKRTPKKETIQKIAKILNLGYSFASNGEPYFFDFVDTIEDARYSKNELFNRLQLYDADPSSAIDKKEIIARKEKHDDYVEQLADEIFVQMLNELLELNDSGQQEALKRISELKEISKYKKTDTK